MFDADEAAFHRAILAQPDEPMNFLVYADWLEERGREERAALMRLAPALEVRPGPINPNYVTFAYGDDRLRYSLCAINRLLPRDDPGTVALMTVWNFDGPRHGPLTFPVRADGTSPDNDEWWGWLLATAAAHGWQMPEPAPA